MPRTQSQNVVKFEAHRPQREIEWDSIYKVTQFIQSELMARVRSGVKINKIATAIDMNHQTVSKLAYGETKEPRASTVIRIVHYLGYKVFIR